MIEIKELFLRYPQAERNALHNVSLTIDTGECLGLLGPNGAGKTSLVSLLCGLVKPSSGEIIINGTPFHRLTKKQRSKMALVPQDFAFYPLLSVIDNMKFFAALYGVKNPQYLMDLLAQVGLSEQKNQLSGNLSGGQKRRLNFAIGLINKPEILFLDEITVGIDPEGRQFILNNVKNLLKQGITIIYTSHYLGEIEELCDKIALFANGEKIYYGKINDILTQHGQNILYFSVTPKLDKKHAQILNATICEQDEW
ncbi:MAG: ABC transporter ATP-binding protein, partial [Neisseriaceae bacterium]|nr:ABC transporter ATP-binding protein [Neisseriaceae bacterium]